MAKLSEEPLKKLTKPKLIAISMNLQEKPKSSKNISELLLDRLVNMEKQCWANAPYSRRVCI